VGNDYAERQREAQEALSLAEGLKGAGATSYQLAKPNKGLLHRMGQRESGNPRQRRNRSEKCKMQNLIDD